MKSMLSLCAAGLLLLALALWTHRGPAMEISNASGLEVERYAILVDGAEVAAGRLGAGEIDRRTVTVRREGPVELQLRFAGGGDSRLHAGWFSPGQAGLRSLTIVSPDSATVGSR